MSSYHTSFTYLNKNSYKDFKWIIVHFDPDNGETDSFLSQDQIYTDSYNGKKRLLYGTRWNTTPVTKITVIKQNGADFTLQECRDAYKWLTGNPQASWLSLYVGEQIKYEFLGTVQDVKPYKLDARTVSLNIYFESITPWAYSPQQFASCSFGQSSSASEDGVLYANDSTLFAVSDDGTLIGKAPFQMTDDGVAYIDSSVSLSINNKTDDLYSYIYLDTIFSNYNSDELHIKNITLGEETVITSIAAREIINLTAEQFIISDKPNKIFGDTFNFVWPRLAPGTNEFIIYGDGRGVVEFSYRYAMKIGDCAIDTYMSSGDICCGDGGDTPDSPVSGPVAWDDITNKPTTVKGYGITDAYTILEVDKKLENIDVNADMNIDENELNDMLAGIFDE